MCDAPHALAQLSGENPDGWGIAVFEERVGWTLTKRPASAREDPQFLSSAQRLHGRTLLAHVRQRTVGSATLDNTHPFRAQNWVFAHNGTIDDVEALRRLVSSRRAAEVRGETDSELLFAYVLTRLDAATNQGDRGAANDGAIRGAVEDLLSNAEIGTFNFLLSNGATLYACRRGRPLALLERTGADRGSVLIASEPITGEQWLPVREATLLVVRRDPHVTWAPLLGGLQPLLQGV